MTNRNLNRMKSKGTNKKVEVNDGMMEKESNEKLNTTPQEAAFSFPCGEIRDAAFFAPKTRKEATAYVLHIRRRPGL